MPAKQYRTMTMNENRWLWLFAVMMVAGASSFVLILSPQFLGQAFSWLSLVGLPLYTVTVRIALGAMVWWVDRD